MKAPVKAIVGAWNHTWPNEPYPKPGIEWRHEAVRWFDQWLKGRNTGIMDEPRFAVYVRKWHPPGPYLEEAPGEWRYEDGWPIARIREQPLYPRPDRTLAADRRRRGRSPVALRPDDRHRGRRAGDVVGRRRARSAADRRLQPRLRQRAARAATSRSSACRARCSKSSADAPLRNWFVRLSDVAPDGTVTQVAGAGFNGAHRDSARDPRPLEPGERVSLDIEMHFTSWVFPKGHRMRLCGQQRPVADDLADAATR